MVQCAIDPQLDRSVIARRFLTLAKVPLQNLLVLLDCLILVRKVAERPLNPRHKLVDILLAISPVVLAHFGRGVLVVARLNLEDLVRNRG